MDKAVLMNSERELIDRVRRLTGNPDDWQVIKGIGDDCAVIRKDDKVHFLITADTLVEGVHFDLNWHSPYLLGRKAASVNLSDIGAMGGQPHFALLSMAFPGSAPDWLDDFLAGFNRVLQEHDTILIGGDTVKSSNDLSFSVTVIGEAAAEQICYRSGAQPGDLVWVSGTLGDAAAGLALCQAGFNKGSMESSQWQSLIKAHLDPDPQIELGEFLAASGQVHAMMDISDGLATDLAHICSESGVGAVLNGEQLPVSEKLEKAAIEVNGNVMDWVLKGGEDYQLLFTSDPGPEKELQKETSQQLGRKIYCVGKIVEGQGVQLIDNGRQREISYQGYDHFTD
jgi:thiamine-monophosphate kinase